MYTHTHTHVGLPPIAAQRVFLLASLLKPPKMRYQLRGGPWGQGSESGFRNQAPRRQNPGLVVEGLLYIVPLTGPFYLPRVLKGGPSLCLNLFFFCMVSRE